MLIFYTKWELIKHILTIKIQEVLILKRAKQMQLRTVFCNSKIHTYKYIYTQREKKKPHKQKTNHEVL